MPNGLIQLKERLERAIDSDGELILSSFRWELDDRDAEAPLQDPYLGLTEDFLTIIKELCDSPQVWLKLYVELLMELSNESGSLREEFLRLAENLWMQTYYKDLCVWHKAFPPLDGGGSSQAKAFLDLFRAQFPNRKFKTLFEWCCGPGFLGFSFLQAGICEELVLADINPHVVPGIERTIRDGGFEGRVRYYISDNLKSVPSEEKFDLVLGNPPWAYREIPGLPNPLIPNDPEWTIHQGFFSQIGAYLTKDAVLCVSTHDPFKTISYIEEQKEPWDVRPVPPIQEFRRFLSDGGLRITQILKPTHQSQIAMVKGMTFLVIAPESGEDVEPQEFDLIGLGGTAAMTSQKFELDLGLFQKLDLGQSLNSANQLDALKFGLYGYLETNHITSALKKIFGTQERYQAEVGQKIGLPAKIVESFPDWDNPDDFRYQSPIENFKLIAESAGEKVTALRLQLTQDAPVCIGLKVIRDLFAEFGKELDYCLTVKPGFDEKAARRLLKHFDGYSGENVRFFEHGHQTLFAQDNGRLGGLPDGTRLLFVPGQLSPHRPSDTLLSAPLPIVQSSLHWEGGNLLCDGHSVCVGANSIAQTMRHLGLTVEQTKHAFEVETGYPVAILGSVQMALEKTARGEAGARTPDAVDGGQADFHIDLDCCFLGENSEGVRTVALADAELGLNYLDDVLSMDELFSGHFLAPNQAKEHFRISLEKSVTRRADLLALYERELQEFGYKVLRIPDIRLVSDQNYLARVNFAFTYLNALPLRRDGSPTICLLPYGLKSLEDDVEKFYQSAGVSVTWIGDVQSARELSSMRGGMHCFCSILG